MQAAFYQCPLAKSQIFNTINKHQQIIWANLKISCKQLYLSKHRQMLSSPHWIVNTLKEYVNINTSTLKNTFFKESIKILINIWARTEICVLDLKKVNLILKFTRPFKSFRSAVFPEVSCLARVFSLDWSYFPRPSNF